MQLLSNVLKNESYGSSYDGVDCEGIGIMESASVDTWIGASSGLWLKI